MTYFSGYVPHSELVFVVEEAPEGGYTARALDESIFTEADDLDQLRAMVREAVMSHFDDASGHPSCLSTSYTTNCWPCEAASRPNGTRTAVRLRRHYGCEIVRQTGSHMRLTTLSGGKHRVTVPAGHLRVSTLAGILLDVAAHHGIRRSELEERLFSELGKCHAQCTRGRRSIFWSIFHGLREPTRAHPAGSLRVKGLVKPIEADASDSLGST